MLKRTVLALSLFTTIGAAHSANQDEIRKLLTERMPGAQLGAITKAPYGGLYEVVLNGLNVFYTDENANVAIIGKVIDLKTNKDLVEARTQELQHVDFASLPLDKAIVKVKGNGSRKVAVFSDPECPFCQELEKELAKVSDVTIYTFLFPLVEIHPDAERKAKLVWCAEDRAKAWDELMLQGKEPTASEKPCEVPFQAIQEIAKKAWISGTPGLVFADGKLVPGVIKSFQIERNLGASQPKAAAVQSKN
ncbi:MAG: DsbC family protein [Hydrogenophilales bacterium]|nr:DsbC family protein [Hydrogenophilales bacterium]